MAETFVLSTTLLMFLSSSYFIHNVSRDIEKWYCNTYDTGACSCSKMQEKKNGWKNNF